MSFAVDSNILVYAFDSTAGDRHEAAAALMERAPLADCTLIAQCLAEFLNVIRRKQPTYFNEATEQASRWAKTLPVLHTSAEHVINGALFSARYKLQLFDSIIWQIACASSIDVLLSEDLQDGFEAEGMRVLDPFVAANSLLVEALLTESES